jgi:two-component system response regulator AgrA
LGRIRRVVENFITIEQLAMSVICATVSADELLSRLESKEKVAGLYFLDLDLGCDINGIKLAERIREYDPRGFIVFITADGESYKLTFELKVEAMDYIVKGDSNLEARICECICNAHAKLTAKATPLQDNFVFKLSQDTNGLKGTFKLAKDSVVSIDSTKIMFFETSVDTKHTVIVYTAEGRLEFRGSLSQIEKEMDKTRFFRCQRNLIINLEKVIAVDIVQMLITFENGLSTDIAIKQVGKLSRRVREYKMGKRLLGRI